MDGQTVRDLAELISKQIVFDWKLYLWIILLSFVGGGAGSFISSYYGTRGKYYAIKADFEQILVQLAKSTEATEKIGPSGTSVSNHKM